MFISIEGYDAVGKSALIDELCERGYQTVSNHLEMNEDMQGIFGKTSSPVSRLMYYLSMDIEHGKFIERNPDTVFVMDRYYHSTVAFFKARMSHEVVDKVIDAVDRYIVKPDLVVYLACPRSVIESRLFRRKFVDYKDEYSSEFYKEAIGNLESLLSGEKSVMRLDSSELSVSQEADLIEDAVSRLRCDKP